MEAREVRQVWHVGHQTLDPFVERLASVRITEGTIDLTTDFGQHPNEIGDVAAGVLMLDWNSTELREVLLTWIP